MAACLVLCPGPPGGGRRCVHHAYMHIVIVYELPEQQKRGSCAYGDATAPLLFRNLRRYS